MNYWIWFASLNEIGPVRKMHLLEKFKTPECIYFAKDKELLKVEGITSKLLETFKASKNENLLMQYEEYILKHNIKIINIYDNEYPKSLKEIYAPPISLFAKGDITLLNNKRNWNCWM